MAWKKNKIAVEWLESKDKGLVHCVNIKHVLGGLSNTMERTEVVVQFLSLSGES